MDQLYLTLSFQAVGIFYLIIGLLTVIGDKDNKNRLAFFVVSMTYAAWALYSSLMNATPDPRNALIFMDLRRFFKVMRYPVILQFLFRVSGLEKKYLKEKSKVFLLYLPSILVTLLYLANPSSYDSLIRKNYGWTFRLGVGMDFLLVIGSMAYSILIILFLLYLYLSKQEVRRERQTYFYILVVTLITEGLLIYAETIIPASYLKAFDILPNIPPIGSILVMPQIVVIYYLIQKNQFLNIDMSELIRMIIDDMDDGIIVENNKKEIIYCNQGMLEMSDYENRDQIKGKKLEEITEFRKLDIGNRQMEEYMTFRDRYGNERHIFIKFFNLYDRFGDFYGGIYTLKDVTDLINSIKELAIAENTLQQQVEERTRELQMEIETRKKSEEKYRFIAYHDSMTKLLNRRSLFEKAETTLEENQDHQHALLFMDINFFKKINDQYGHSEGDRMLITTADWLKEVYKEDAYVARFGGDEFVVFVANTSQEEVEDYIQKMYDRFKEDYMIQGKKHKISLSHGCSLYPRDGTDMDKLIKIADQRMYEDKKKKKLSIGVDQEVKKDIRQSPR